MALKDILFGRERQGTVPVTKGNPRADLIQAVENALITIMAANFAMMGLEAQQIPTAGGTGSLRSRGYLLGLTEGVIQQYAALHPSQEEFITAFASAFAVTYGPCDWRWALTTIDEFQANNPSIVEGVLLGRRDAAVAFSDQPYKVMTGFWLLNNGDEEAIQYNLAGLTKAL
jgi:hypothetical protein